MSQQAKVQLPNMQVFHIRFCSTLQGKKLPQSVEEAEDDEGEVSDEDEAMDMDPEELSKIQPKPEEVATPASAAAAETSGEEVWECV